MRLSILSLLLLGALVCGLSLALPAADLPETRYDESEQLPYDSIPLFSSEVVQEPSRAPQAPLKSGSPFHLGSPTGPDEIRAKQSREPKQLISDSLIILVRTLRC